MGKIIGIDLGTTNSCVSVVEGGQPIVIANSEGARTTPSIVGFTDNGERKVGEPAKRQAITNPKRTVTMIKRFMGEEYDNVTEDIKRATYEVKKGKNNMPLVAIDDKEYTPQEISAIILQKMKQTAEDYLGEKVTEAIITCPAYYNNNNRAAVIEAGKIAGLEVKRVINEPTAAALAYGIDKKGKEEKICVFDFGGGTHDVSILQISDGLFEVLATKGDTHLGGGDIDRKIADWLIEEFKKDNANFDLSKDVMAMQRISEAAEKAKIELSNTTSTEINLPYITAIDGVPCHLVKTLTRAKFEQLISDIVAKTIAPCKLALEQAKLTKNDIDEVILVGGSTRIPLVQEEVKKFFGKEPCKGVNPDECVSIGAAIQGNQLATGSNDVLLLDVISLSLGIETMGGVCTKLVEAGTTIPCKKTEIFSTAADNQPAVTIVVCQGERPMAKDNKQIGTFTLDGIMPAKRGVPQIEVSFDIDANGVLTVSATDKGTGKEQHIKVEANGGLSDADIERMKKEAEDNAESDKKAKEEADTRNAADGLVFQTEKLLSENAEKLSDEQKKSLEEPMNNLKNELKEGKIEDITKLKDTLQEAWYKVSSELYQQANPSGNTGTETNGSNPFENMGTDNSFAGK